MVVLDLLDDLFDVGGFIYMVMYDCVTAVWDNYAVVDRMTMVMVMIRSGAVFRSEGSPSNPKDLCHFQLEVKDVCWKHRRSFGFKGQPHKSFRSKGLARVPSMKSI